MRTTLFLTTLFAATLVTGAALAEKPTDRLRAHGDMVDKNHRAGRQAAGQPGTSSSNLVRPASMIDQHRGTSRVSCSDTSVDCAAARGSSHATGVAASKDAAGHVSRAPAFLDKILGSERTSFNEAGESNGMSTRAARRVWSSAGGGQAGAQGGAQVPLAQQHQVMRTQQQASDNRTACNEGDQCMASSKKSKTEWSYQAVKGGTWKGPEAKQQSPADRAVQAMKAANGSEGTRSKP